MARLIQFTRLNGERGWFDLGETELLLDGSRSNHLVVYRNKRGRWVVGSTSPQGGIDYTEVTDTDAAWLFVEHGFEPPMELAYLIAAEDIDQPWLAPGTKRWRSKPDSGLDQTLYLTPCGKTFIYRHGDLGRAKRMAGVSAVEACNWLAHCGFDIPDELELRAEAEWNEVNAIRATVLPGRETISIPLRADIITNPIGSPQRGPCEMSASDDRITEDQGGSHPIAGRIGETQPDHNLLSPAVACAYRSFEQAMRENPSLRKDEEIYKFLREFGPEEDDYKLPNFETWSRYLRIARNKLGGQKNHPRAGRGYGKSILRQRETG